MSEPELCIGAISGTSMDSIDVAAVRTDGKEIVERAGFMGFDYPGATRSRLQALGSPPDHMELDEIEPQVTKAFLDAITGFMGAQSLAAADVGLVGCHGQTVHHDPGAGLTIQLCNNARLAHEIGVAVVGDFRAEDVKAGGEGAPLAPLYHRALSSALDKPVVFLNLGGVGNLTYVGEDGGLVAFDTGPANALLDDLMRERLSRDLDEDGRLAASGKADRRLVEDLATDPWFAAKPPKSLDRNHFHSVMERVQGLATPDAAATLAAFTVESVALALAHLPREPLQWLVTGGGRHNAHMMASLRDRLGQTVVAVDEAIDADGDAMEAEAFAYLAMRSRLLLPISLPSTTGVPVPMTGGRIYGKVSQGLAAKDAGS